MAQKRAFSSDTHSPSPWRTITQGRGPLVITLLLAALVLSACLSFLAPTVGPVRTPVVLPGANNDQPQIAISPPSGYAGVYVQVVGNGWPANELVLMALSDDVGRSGILAASAANVNGQVTTGFLYPISPRWLTSGPHTIVAYTSDGNMQATAEFNVTPGDDVTPVATGQTGGETTAQPGTPPPSPTATAMGSDSQPPTALPTTAATPTPSATATAQSNPTPIVITDWRGDYWANSTLSGDALLVRNDSAVFFDWGSGSPAPNLPADQFSARWTRQLNFDAGVYTFFLEVDDGARLFIDDQLVLDEWRAGSQRIASARVSLTTGQHTLRVEYFERTGNALARFWWERQIAFTGWEGRYYNNPNLQGEPTLVRDDAAINFDWGGGSPTATIGDDNFSVRWKRTVSFDPGRYRFYARMDDGMRVRVDGQLLLDEWQDASDRTVGTEVDLPGGSYEIEVEYYEKSGAALVSFWWELAPEPTPTHTATWTPTWTPTQAPTSAPTNAPSATPTATAMPTQTPSPSPSPTPGPTATDRPDSAITPTVTPDDDSSTSDSGPGATEIGQSVPFTQVLLPLLLPPKVDIYQVVTADDEWTTLLDSMRPPKTARPALRPPANGRNATPTPTPTPTPSPTPVAVDSDSSGLPKAEDASTDSDAVVQVEADFSTDIVLVAILGVKQIDQSAQNISAQNISAQIVDVRLDSNHLFVIVDMQRMAARLAPDSVGANAVIVKRDSLPSLDSLTVHFIDTDGKSLEEIETKP